MSAKTPDALATLGTLLDETARRDAIHVAVEPAIAAHTLRPGDDVGFLGDGTVGSMGKPVGIVDPFLKSAVLKGQRFWLFVYPRTITNLRHVWSHPDFKGETAAARAPSPTPTEAQKQASEEWLRNFVASSDCPSYDDVMAAATGQHHLNGGQHGYNCSRNSGEYLHFGGQEAHGEIPPEFWDHVEAVSGQKIPPEERASWFSCSC